MSLLLLQDSASGFIYQNFMFSGNYYLIYYKILTFFSLGLGAYLSFLIYLSDRKAPTNRLFILLTFFTLTWATGPYFANLMGLSEKTLLYIRFCYATAPLNGYFAYILVTRLFSRITESRFLDVFALALALFDFFLAFLPSIVKTIELTNWGISPIFGGGAFLYFLIIVFFTVLVPYLMIKAYKGSNPIEKSQYSLFLVGFFIAILTGAGGNVFAPLFGMHPAAKYWLIGCFDPIFFISFTALAMFKGRAFNVKSILTDFLVGIFAVALFVFLLFLEGLMKIAGLFLFTLFAIIGYLLIQYTHQEVHQKRILEQKVKERTKDLEKAKDIAEQRAKEIEKRKADLEHFYKLTVGRELKMVELKKRIKKLEGKRERELEEKREERKGT